MAPFRGSGGELKGVDFSVFMDNLVFESVFYKGTSKIHLLFELFLRLHQVHMMGEMIFHVIHITGTLSSTQLVKLPPSKK